MDRYQNSGSNDVASQLAEETRFPATARMLGLQATLMQKMFDEVKFAVFLLDSDGGLLFANRAARALLGHSAALNFVQDVIGDDAADDRVAFDSAMRQCLRGARPLARFDRFPGREFFFTPIHDGHRAAFGMVMLTATRDELCDPETLHDYASHYQLTKSEREVLTLIMAGKSAEEIAEQRNVTEATVRTHIKNTLHKTGHRTLRQLQARLGKLPPV